MRAAWRILLISVGVLTGLGKSAFAIGVIGGDIPIPAKLVGSVYQSDWDGSYSDLLAADALAMCWTTQVAPATAFISGGETDNFISTLLSRMTAATCKACSNQTYTAPEDITICAYLDSRKDPTCNMDAASRQAKALNVSKLRSSSQTQDYVLPSAATLGLTSTATPNAADLAVRNAQEELSYAELTLCMAEQLNQQLDTVQVAFASGDDLLRVQDAVRDLALTSAYEYGVIGKTLTSTSPITTPLALNSSNSSLYYLLPLALWGRLSTGLTATKATHVGDDFAQAIKLLIEATESSIELNLRAPEAQDSFGTPTWVGTTFSGMTGPRQDILAKVLYDGNGELGNKLRRSAVLTDMAAPQVGVLLGLARQANALKLHVSGNPQFISATNASTLMLAVENNVRNADCTNRGIPPASCTLATGTTLPVDYLLWQRYGITMSHAQTLVDSLTEAMFGPPTPASRQTGAWVYEDLFTKGITPTRPAEQLTMHFLGTQQFSGNLATSFPVGDITIDPNFSVAAPNATEIQGMRPYVRLPVRDVDPRGRAQNEIGSFRGSIVDYTAGYPTYRRGLSSNTVLALAREALLQLAQASGNPHGIYTEAAPVLTLIESMIGVRQATVRETLSTSADSASCSGCFTFTTPSNPTAPVPFTVDLLSNSSDPFAAVAVGQGIPLAATLARDSQTRTVFGATQATAIAPLTFTAPSATSLAAGYVQRQATGNWTQPTQVSVILKTTTGPVAYQHVFTGGFHDYTDPTSWNTGRGVSGTVVTFGGRFGQEAGDAWAFDFQRWATPKVDGFGLTRDWTPAADASLFGESPGVSVESHFLNRATVAADESAVALQQAFDSLQQQAVDDAAVASSDTRAQQLTNLEFQAVCGTLMTACSPAYQRMVPVVPACTGPASPDCEAFRTILGALVGNPVGGPALDGIPLTSAVATELQNGNPAPIFGAYQGGSLQGLFVSQWSSWRALNAAMTSAVATTQSAIAQVAAAVADQSAAVADYNSVTADVNTMMAQVVAQNATLDNQRVIYNAQKVVYDAQFSAAKTTAQQDCSATAFQSAYTAGKSYSDNAKTNADWQADANGWSYNISNFKSASWSPSSLIAQVARCQASQNALQLATVSTAQQKSVMDAQLRILDAQAIALGVQTAAKQPRLDAAEAHQESAELRVAAARQAVASQENAALQSVQTALGQVLGSVAAIQTGYTQANLAAAKNAVDQQQINYDVRARFGLRARFHSYDLWRARALTENARRLALAARRAIESRYVVDLSAMSSPEPFVDSPSLWADQIYAPDLKPFTIGLSPAPTSGSSLNASAVKDYVGNLSLFLDGFVVQRPSASVIADAEVIQVPAPAAQVVTSTSSGSVAYIDPASSGWSFYCPSTGTWIADPDVGRFVTGVPTWSLATACAGTPPTLARVSFTLDPWGRPQGTITAPPYSSRYNVRTGAVALNLVGSGIRACQNAPDPATCFAEPFIRYDLKHVGPAWVTNYDGQWRALSIPRAVVEAGKALATEEWLDPVSNGFNRPDVANVIRREFEGRPIGGAYELTLYLSPDVQVERIARIQLLAQTAYWVREQ